MESGSRSREPAAGERGRLVERGVRPRRGLGQNFLLDPRVPRETVGRAAWAPGTPVLEIGAGGGALTVELLAAGLRVTAVEIDPVLVTVLCERFAAEIADGRLRVVEGDILRLPLEPILDALEAGPVRLPGAAARAGSSDFAGPEVREPDGALPGSGLVPSGRPWIAGNLPYNVTTPILLRVLAHAGRLDGAVFMVQREYGDRLLARAGEDAYSSISVRTSAQALTRKLLLVGRSAFWPRPGVESLVVELTFPRPAPYGGSIPALERILRAAFGQRRKTIENALAHGLGRTKEEARVLLRQAGCDPGARAETFPLDRFAALASLVGEA